MRKPMEDRKIVVIWEFILHFPIIRAMFQTFS